MSKRERRIFLPEGTLLALPGYEIVVAGAREGFATLIVRKSGKKFRGVKYESIIIDDVVSEEVEGE